MTNALYYGDNLDVLRESIASESVDLVYLDPPFNSQASYNLLFKSPSGAGSQAQIEAFEDTWHWGQEAEGAFDQVMRSGNTDASDMLRAMRSLLTDNDMMAYLAMMAVRLLELRRVMKSTGSIYLHCDTAASHYLKIVMDSIYGKENFRNEISWRRSGRRSSISRIYRRAHDVILFYSKSDGYFFDVQYEEHDRTLIDKYSSKDESGVFRLVPLMASGRRNGETGKLWRGFDPNTRGKAGMHWITIHSKLEAYVEKGLVVFPKKPDGVPQLKYYLEQNKGVPASDFWDDIDLINSMGTEALGYPTQKPIALLERIMAASSKSGETVLDPFCGCGTTIHTAQKMGRQWIGIDVTHLAISLIERRLKDAFPGISFEVHGTPQDIDGARDLAQRDKYQFQWWAISLIDAQPYGGKKKGADGGIDGLIYFRSDAKTTERAIVSVKGGGVSVPMVRDLKGVLDREKAPIGVFLTLEPPTRPMEKEAASAGLYTLGTRQYPRLQIITIEQALAGMKPAIPLIDTGAAFKRAAREQTGQQGKLI